MRHSWDLMQALYLVDLSTTLARVRVLVTILARLAWRQQETSTANSVREELVIFVREFSKIIRYFSWKIPQRPSKKL